MKDAYSFHTSQEDLDASTIRNVMKHTNAFLDVWNPEVVTVASDAGMMGGNLSHEYMLLNGW